MTYPYHPAILPVPWTPRSRHAPATVRQSLDGSWYLVNGYGVWGLSPHPTPSDAVQAARLVAEITPEGQEIMRNPLLAIVGNPPAGLPSTRQSVVSNVYTGETRTYPLGAANATRAAAWEENPGAVPTAELSGEFYRTGSWVARGPTRNPKKAGKRLEFWWNLLDTIDYINHELGQVRGGVASITKDQWINRYPRLVGKRTKRATAETAWERFVRRIRREDKEADAGIEVEFEDQEPGWLHIDIPSAYDAAWRAGEGRVLPPPVERFRKLAQIEAGEIPGEYMPTEEEIQREAERMRAEHVLAEEEGSGRLERRKANPNEGEPGEIPKSYEISLDEAKDLDWYEQAYEDFVAFHESEPTRAVVYVYDDGSEEEHWAPVHAALHETIETNYRVPWRSNKQKHIWTHPHKPAKGGALPLEAKDPRTGNTIKILRGTRADDWWRY